MWMLTGVGFVNELATWWRSKCCVIEHNTPFPKVQANTVETDSSPGVMSSQDDSELPGNGADQIQGEDVLSTLEGIGVILQKGFSDMDTQLSGVKKSMKTSNANMVALNANFDSAFKDLAEKILSDNESEYEDSVVSDGHRPADSQEDPSGDSRNDDHGLGDSGQHGDTHGLSSSEDESVLTSKSKEIELDTSVGPPIQDAMAEFIAKSYSKKWKYVELEKKKTAYPRPINAECLSTPKVNDAVLAKPGVQVKNRDRSWQNNHVIFSSAVTAMSRVVDLLKVNEKSAPRVKEALSLSADALNLCGALNTEWIKARREDIKTVLPEDFKRLVSDDVPASHSWLFGNDLEGSIKAVEVHNRLAKKMEPSTSKDKKTPQAANAGGYNKRRYNNKRKRGGKQKNDDRYNDGDSYKKRNSSASSKDFQKRGANR